MQWLTVAPKAVKMLWKSCLYSVVFQSLLDINWLFSHIIPLKPLYQSHQFSVLILPTLLISSGSDPCDRYLRLGRLYSLGFWDTHWSFTFPFATSKVSRPQGCPEPSSFFPSVLTPYEVTFSPIPFKMSFTSSAPTWTADSWVRLSTGHPTLHLSKTGPLISATHKLVSLPISPSMTMHLITNHLWWLSHSLCVIDSSASYIGWTIKIYPCQIVSQPLGLLLWSRPSLFLAWTPVIVISQVCLLPFHSLIQSVLHAVGKVIF